MRIIKGIGLLLTGCAGLIGDQSSRMNYIVTHQERLCWQCPEVAEQHYLHGSGQ